MIIFMKIKCFFQIILKNVFQKLHEKYSICKTNSFIDTITSLPFKIQILSIKTYCICTTSCKIMSLLLCDQKFDLDKGRSSRPEVFCKKCVLKIFTKFTGKHLCQSLFFSIVAGKACNFIKIERLWPWCLPVNFAKF